MGEQPSALEAQAITTRRQPASQLLRLPAPEDLCDQVTSLRMGEAARVRLVAVSPLRLEMEQSTLCRLELNFRQCSCIAEVDKGDELRSHVVISPEGKSQDLDGDGYYIRDGIVVVPKNSVIKDGTWI